MSHTGRRPKPTALKLADDTFRADRHGDPSTEVKPPEGEVVRPDGMTEAAIEIWNEITPILNEMGVFTIADRRTIVRYCNLAARSDVIEAYLQEHGGTVQSLYGPKAAPEVAEGRSLCTELLKIEREFGLTPSARTSLHITPKEKKGLPSRKRG